MAGGAEQAVSSPCPHWQRIDGSVEYPRRQASGKEDGTAVAAIEREFAGMLHLEVERLYEFFDSKIGDQLLSVPV